MYLKLKRIYDREQLPVFVMAVSNLLDKGFAKVQKITEEDIKQIKMPENSFMITEFAQYLTGLTKEIADNCDSVVEIIQFCSKVKCFDQNYGRR